MISFENQNIEFKQEYVSDIRKEVMGFANAEGGSVLYVYGNAGTLYIDHTVSVYQTSFHVYEVCVKASWDENGR